MLSSDEYVGAIIAAAVARELGLPAADPGKIILAQHKFYSREAQRRVAPEATPPAVLLPISGVKPEDVTIEFPFFVKPCKGTFSVFADKVADFAALKKHLSFNILERLAINRVAKPYNDLLREFTDLEHDASHFCGEGLMKGDQVTVEGFAFDGRVQVMGVDDSVMSDVPDPICRWSGEPVYGM